MPDDAHKLVFPRGVPVEVTRVRSDHETISLGHPASRGEESADTSTVAEGGLTTEAETIESQAQSSRLPEQGDDLLRR